MNLDSVDKNLSKVDSILSKVKVILRKHWGLLLAIVLALAVYFVWTYEEEPSVDEQEQVQ